MTTDYKTITHNLMELECYRRYGTHALLRNSGIYFGQPPLMEYLCKHGSCTQNELAKALNVSPASVAVSVKRMQKSGLVAKASDENDLRRNIISITDKGRQQGKLIDSRFDEMDRKMYKGFSENELSQFNSYIERIIGNMSQDAPDKDRIFDYLKSDFPPKNGGDGE